MSTRIIQAQFQKRNSRQLSKNTDTQISINSWMTRKEARKARKEARKPRSDQFYSFIDTNCKI